MFIKSYPLISILILAILAACGTTRSIGDATPAPTQAYQPMTETQDSEYHPTSTITPGPDQTKTAFANAAATGQFTEQTLIAPYPPICEVNFAPREFSPDGSWMVEFCYSEQDHSPILTISSKETNDLWKLVYSNYIQHTDFLPDGGLGIVHWTLDGGYTYFASYTSGSGGECFVNGDPKTGVKGLFRLDLMTGQVTTLLPLQDSFIGYSFSFSPTGRRLVYDTHSAGLNILDIRTGNLIRVGHNTEFGSEGGYLWSPDGLKFMYSTSSDGAGNYSLRLVDGQSGSEQIVLESRDHCFAAKQWVDNSILLIESESQNAESTRTLIEYDVNAMQITNESTATPRP